MEELIDVLDDDGKKTGITKRKSLIKKDGDYHRAVAICFISPSGDVLLQKRSNIKKVYPDLWSVFLKGHVKSGEDAITAGIREAEEELSLQLQKDDFIYLYTIKEEKSTNNYCENIFFDTYLVIKNIDIQKIKMNEEVSDICLVNCQVLQKIIMENNPYLVPNYQDYDRIVPILDKVFVELGLEKEYELKKILN